MTQQPKRQEPKPSVVCAWCKRTIRDGDPSVPVTHGMCNTCAEASGVIPVEPMSHLPPDVIAALPFGAIGLSGAGRVTSYNRSESLLSGRDAASVIGRDFFREVAPCTSVQRFAGVYQAMRAGGADARREFAFLMKFAHGPVFCRVVLTWEHATDTGVILIAREDS